MGKGKLKKWAEMKDFQHVIQPQLEEVLNNDYLLKGQWGGKQFKNNNPVVLELGCGKGEYTLGLARSFPEKNFIGIDIKGARIWRGAKTAKEEKLGNVCFLRTRIEFIDSFFGKDEIEEIWITFPDPQLKRGRIKKRLTGSGFLNSYRYFLKPGGLIHLKTDSSELFNYTKQLLIHNGLKEMVASSDLYSSSVANEFLKIKTHYEQVFLGQGKKIKYLQFLIDGNNKITEPLFDKEHG